MESPTSIVAPATTSSTFFSWIDIFRVATLGGLISSPLTRFLGRLITVIPADELQEVLNTKPGYVFLLGSLPVLTTLKVHNWASDELGKFEYLKSSPLLKEALTYVLDAACWTSTSAVISYYSPVALQISLLISTISTIAVGLFNAMQEDRLRGIIKAQTQIGKDTIDLAGTKLKESNEKFKQELERRVVALENPSKPISADLKSLDHDKSIDSAEIRKLKTEVESLKKSNKKSQEDIKKLQEANTEIAKLKELVDYIKNNDPEALVKPVNDRIAKVEATIKNMEAKIAAGSGSGSGNSKKRK